MSVLYDSERRFETIYKLLGEIHEHNIATDSYINKQNKKFNEHNNDASIKYKAISKLLINILLTFIPSFINIFLKLYTYDIVTKKDEYDKAIIFINSTVSCDITFKRSLKEFFITRRKIKRAKKTYDCDYIIL